VKAGDIHVCPRGMAHATRVTGTDEMKVISIFAPPQAGGNDRIMLDD
jgi:mannose-6-phosphate isomerase-like protein (cupin superfamily)